MNIRIIRRGRAAAWLAPLVLALAIPAAAAAQQRATSVRVALVDELPVHGARAVVVREGGAAGAMTILLTRASANPEMLAGALSLARRLRARSLEPTGRFVAPLAGAVRRRPASSDTERRLAALLHRLEEQPAVRIGNLGTGRWVETAMR